MVILHRKLISFIGWSWTDRWLFAQAYIGLGLARMAVLTLPFRWLSKCLGNPGQEAPRRGLTAEHRLITRQIAWAICAASRYTPWDSNCLAQAVTGKIMLRRRGLISTLYLGLTRPLDNPEAIEAHAWLRSGKFYLVGGNGNGYTVVATFGSNTNIQEIL